jgi:hypothetical protein
VLQQSDSRASRVAFDWAVQRRVFFPAGAISLAGPSESTCTWWAPPGVPPSSLILLITSRANPAPLSSTSASAGPGKATWGCVSTTQQQAPEVVRPPPAPAPQLSAKMSWHGLSCSEFFLHFKSVTEVLTEVHCSFITLLWYGCFRSSSKVLTPMRVKGIPQEQPLPRPQHLRHIPITVHMRIRVKGATTRRGARNIGGVGDNPPSCNPLVCRVCAPDPHAYETDQHTHTASKSVKLDIGRPAKRTLMPLVLSHENNKCSLSSIGATYPCPRVFCTCDKTFHCEVALHAYQSLPTGYDQSGEVWPH